MLCFFGTTAYFPSVFCGAFGVAIKHREVFIFMKIVIVGGVAAGGSAAARARRMDDTAEIILLEKGSYVSFANCGLPYYLGGEIPNRDSLLLVRPELFRNRFHVQVRLNNEVTEIRRKEKTVLVSSPEGVYEESYDKLILATGSEPIVPAIEGAALENIHTVFTIDDVDAIMSKLDNGVEHAVIVGAGFIGIETAENLVKRGIPTTIVEMKSQILSILDPEFSPPIEAHMKDAGLEVRLNQSVKAFRGENKVEEVILSDGTALPADLVIISAGVRPRSQLAAAAGLEIGKYGGIVVNEYMQTSDPCIYAAGDAAESRHMVTGKPVSVALAGNANKQGRIAGSNAVGGRLRYKGTLATSILKIFDLTAARTGLTEREALANGLDCFSVFIPAPYSVRYYPDAGWMILKLTALKDSGKIIGAQAVGDKGVDKRIDVIAASIYAGLTVYDLENLDLCYAPPYSSPKSPEILAGMVASNVLRGDIRLVLPYQLEQFLKETNAELIDVREIPEWNAGHIEGARLIPLDELRKNPEQLDKSKTYAVYCGVGKRAYDACRFLTQHGYDVFNVTGGYDAYIMDV